MWCSVRQYRGDPAKVADMMHIADEEFAEQLSQEPGFIEYHLLDCGDGQVCSITLFSDREGAERSAELAADFVRDRLAAFEITRTTSLSGEVMVNRAASEVLEAVHA